MGSRLDRQGRNQAGGSCGQAKRADKQRAQTTTTQQTTTTKQTTNLTLSTVPETHPHPGHPTKSDILRRTRAAYRHGLRRPPSPLARRRNVRQETRRAERGAPFSQATLDRLATAAADLRRFLARVHFAHETVPGMMPGALYHPTEVFDLAKARYEHVWMPSLASENSASPRKLAAPLDVQWMHHLHRLDPDAYRVDCERAFGRLVDPADPFLVAGDGAPSDDQAAESFARVRGTPPRPSGPSTSRRRLSITAAAAGVSHHAGPRVRSRSIRRRAI